MSVAGWVTFPLGTSQSIPCGITQTSAVKTAAMATAVLHAELLQAVQPSKTWGALALAIHGTNAVPITVIWAQGLTAILSCKSRLANAHIQCAFPMDAADATCPGAAISTFKPQFTCTCTINTLSMTGAAVRASSNTTVNSRIALAAEACAIAAETMARAVIWTHQRRAVPPHKAKITLTASPNKALAVPTAVIQTLKS